jgi:gamma-glutamyltranspeptidase/glutathione hydrolase
MSKDYAARRRELINPQRAAAHADAGDPYPFQNDQSVPLRPARSKLLAEGAHTTHLTVSDKDGNIVSYTFTIESWGGSGITVPGYGFLLNNEMTDFDFSGPHPNVPEAGKRPRSSMSPTLAFRNGKPAFSVGSPGGSTIITTVLQTIVNHIDLGMTMSQAVDAPRLSERNNSATNIEPGYAASDAARALEKYGQRWSPAQEEIGAANALLFNADGTVTAVSEGWRHGVGSAQVQKLGH